MFHKGGGWIRSSGRVRLLPSAAILVFIMLGTVVVTGAQATDDNNDTNNKIVPPPSAAQRSTRSVQRASFPLAAQARCFGPKKKQPTIKRRARSRTCSDDAAPVSWHSQLAVLAEFVENINFLFIVSFLSCCEDADASSASCRNSQKLDEDGAVRLTWTPPQTPQVFAGQARSCHTHNISAV